MHLTKYLSEVINILKSSPRIEDATPAPTTTQPLNLRALILNNYRLYNTSSFATKYQRM